jgi:phospholipid transport system substrate-binding protein
MIYTPGFDAAVFRRTFAAVVVALSMLVGALLSTTGRAAAAEDERALIEQLARAAIATVADRQLSEAERDEHFRTLFVSSFDIPEIGRFVLGRYWRTASAEQQQEFLKLFEDINVLTWTKRFEGYEGEALETLGQATPDGERFSLIESQITRPHGPPIPVRWRLHLGDDGRLRIVDIIVEGVSMAITNRSDYTAALQANGGKLDALLSSMRTKIDQLRAAG